MRILSIATSAITTITCLFLFRHNSLHAEPTSISSDSSNHVQDKTVPFSLSTPNILSVSAPEAINQRPFEIPQTNSPAALLGSHTVSNQSQISAPNIPSQTSPVEPNPTEAPTQLPPSEEIENLEQELDSFQPDDDNPYRGSPAITLSVPSGFGADRGRTFISAGVQRTRFPTTDGGAGFGIGLGNSTKAVGVQLSYTIVSVSLRRRSGLSDRPFGSGAFNVKIHRQFPGGWSAAIGADGLVNIGKVQGGNFPTSVYNEFENTYYAVVTRIIPLSQNINAPFSRLSLTLGAGSGRFRTEEQILRDRSSFIVNPFASAALRVNRSTSLIVEWTAQDLGVGLSIVPFRNLPLVLTPAIRDLAGPDAEKPRFIFGVGLSL